MKYIRLSALVLSGALTLSLLAACGSKGSTFTPTPEVSAPPAVTESGAAQSVSISTIWDKVSASLELPGLTDLDDDLLSSLYGISAADLEEYVAKMPLMNVQSTEFFIAKVKPGKMDAVKAGITKRQADLVEQWKQYLPAQLELVENYKLITSGDYIMFAVADGVDSAVTAFNDCTK